MRSAADGFIESSIHLITDRHMWPAGIYFFLLSMLWSRHVKPSSAKGEETSKAKDMWPAGIWQSDVVVLRLDKIGWAGWCIAHIHHVRQRREFGENYIKEADRFFLQCFWFFCRFDCDFSSKRLNDANRGVTHPWKLWRAAQQQKLNSKMLACDCGKGFLKNITAADWLKKRFITFLKAIFGLY